MPKFLAVDFGLTRIGLAFSEGELALPIEPIQNDQNALAKIRDESTFRKVEFIIVGLPLGLTGNQTQATISAIAFARDLARISTIPVRMLDERLTTKVAAGELRDGGYSSKTAKSRIDSQSAVQILNSAISQSKLGKQPGIGLEELDD